MINLGFKRGYILPLLVQVSIILILQCFDVVGLPDLVLIGSFSLGRMAGTGGVPSTDSGG